VPERYAPSVTEGWGRTPVEATVDGTTWSTSVWREKSGRTLLPCQGTCGREEPRRYGAGAHRVQRGVMRVHSSAHFAIQPKQFACVACAAIRHRLVDTALVRTRTEVEPNAVDDVVEAGDGRMWVGIVALAFGVIALALTVVFARMSRRTPHRGRCGCRTP
jgi:hypothetical protein